MTPVDEARVYEDFLSRLPPDGRARLREPTDEDLAPRMHYGCRPGSPISKHVLPAKDRSRTPSRFLNVHPAALLGENADKSALWSRLPRDVTSWGDGDWLYKLKRRPRWLAWLDRRPCVTIERAAEGFPELWAASKAFVASPAAHELIRRYEPKIVTVDIDCRFDDGTSRHGYVILDFVGRRYAHDFMKSDVEVYLSDGRRYLRMGTNRTIRDDVPADVHAFRAHLDQGLYFSRELAEHVERLAPGQFRYFDDNLGEGVQLARQRIRSKHANSARAADSQPRGPAPKQVLQRLIPLLRSCDLRGAERLLVEALRATPGSPYHIAADLRVETPGETVAEYFDSFLGDARREHRIAAVYSELNGFTINPDEWYCSAVGFDKDGGRDDYDWLGDFNAFSEARLVVRGLEPLQQVFAESMVLEPGDGEEFKAARDFAAALVLVKFQSMLQDALPLMRAMDVPLLAAAHDWYGDYVVEIRPRPI